MSAWVAVVNMPGYCGTPAPFLVGEQIGKAYDVGMPLRLVPKDIPALDQAVLERIKKWKRPDGIIQCNRCGGRTILNTVNGAVIKNGRKSGGTKIDVDMCADCWKQGIRSHMLPEPPKQVK